MGEIWIEPDWNVKQIVYVNKVISYTIWIEPDWNVKTTPTAEYKTLALFE